MDNKGHNTLSKYDVNMRIDDAAGEAYVWYSPMDAPFHIAGLAWFEQERIYRRLPKHTSVPIPEAVDHMANHTAGGQIRFQTDSGSIAVRVKLKAAADMNHMPATGQCGIDCYIGEPGKMEFCSVTKYEPQLVEYASILFRGWDRAMRNVVLNLPLYQGVEEIWVGLQQGAEVMAAPPYISDKKVVIYGTSVTQGGCASRPGMAYSNILSRRIPYEFINLGFSGNGRGEPEVAEVISQIENPACLVLDYEGNCGGTQFLIKTLPEFIRIYRSVHPKVPILIPSRIRYSRENLTPHLLEWRLERKQFEQDLVEKMRNNGDENIYFFDGSNLLGGEDFHECTVDGTHPTDLGFLRMANGLEPIYRAILS